MKIAYLIRAHYAPAPARAPRRPAGQPERRILPPHQRPDLGRHAREDAGGRRRADERPVGGARGDLLRRFQPRRSRRSPDCARSPRPSRTSHTVILSGQDYPARPTHGDREVLRAEPGQELRRALRAAGGRQVARRARWTRPGPVPVLRAGQLQDPDASPPDPAPAIPRRAAAVRGRGLVRALARRGALHRRPS